MSVPAPPRPHAPGRGEEGLPGRGDGDRAAGTVTGPRGHGDGRSGPAETDPTLEDPQWPSREYSHSYSKYAPF